jgi:hypothetical protein
VAGRPRLQIGRPAPFLFVFLDQCFFGFFFVLFLGKDAFLVGLIQIDQLLAQGLGAYVLSTLAPPPPQLVSITQRKIEITNPPINYFLILTLILADSNNSVTDANNYAVDTGMSIDSMRYPARQTPLQ